MKTFAKGNFHVYAKRFCHRRFAGTASADTLHPPRRAGEHAIARQNRAASEQATALPVRKPQFRLVQRVLAVDPTGDAVADKWRIHRVVETLMSLGVFTDQRHGELRAVAIE